MPSMPLLPLALAAELEDSRAPWPAALAPATALDAARAATRALPPLFHWLMLEARLTGDDRSVDLLAAVVDVPGARAEVAAALAAANRPAPLAPLEPVLRSWSSAAAPPLAAVHVLWFEWDAPFTGRAPLCFPSVDPRFWAPRRPPQSALRDLVGGLQLADAGYRLVTGDPAPALLLGALSTLLSALPSAGRLLSAASLHARGRAAARLFVSLPQAAVLPWLGAVAWPGDLAAVQRWLPRIVAPWEPAFLQLEIEPDGRLGPYIALEPRQCGVALVDLRERRASLRLLVDEGLVPADRAHALLAWAGVDLRSGPAPHRELRTFHTKTILQPGRDPVVKGYLGLAREPAAAQAATA